MNATQTIARAAHIASRTKKVEIRDEYGFVVSQDMWRYQVVLATIGRSDLSPGLDARIRTVAYALNKCMTSCRMDPVSKLRIAEYTPYQLCKLVARIADECPETTIGGICDVWLLKHHHLL